MSIDTYGLERVEVELRCSDPECGFVWIGSCTSHAAVGAVDLDAEDEVCDLCEGDEVEIVELLG